LIACTRPKLRRPQGRAAFVDINCTQRSLKLLGTATLNGELITCAPCPAAPGVELLPAVLLRSRDGACHSSQLKVEHDERQLRERDNVVNLIRKNRASGRTELSKNQIYVGNLNPDVTKDDVWKIFEVVRQQCKGLVRRAFPYVVAAA
jgi:hypothetical protein